MRPADGVPAEVSSFVGRDELLVQGADLLTRARLVTLTGAGGVGKTRVALKVASLVAERYDDGVVVVELAGVDNTADRLAGAVAKALGLQDNLAIDGLVGLIVDNLRKRQLLLVLDNCEHLVGTDAAPGPLPGLVQALLKGAGRVTVLATSRIFLGLTGEALLTVPPLEHTSVRGDEQAPEAVRLLLDRAASRRVFLTEEDHPAARRLCAWLQGVPLSIELVAGLLDVQSLGEIVTGLGAEDGTADGIDPLLRGVDSSGLNEPAHHESLWSTMDYSCRLLPAGARRMWAIVAEFEAGATLRAVQAVYDRLGLTGEPVLKLLQKLVHSSVLERVDGAVPERARATAGGPSRYVMLEAVRFYGRELRDGIDRAAIRRARADYYASLAQEAADDWYSRRERRWMRRLFAEVPDLGVTVEYLLSQPEPEQKMRALGIVVNLTRTRLFGYAGILNEGRRLLTRVLEEHPSTPSDAQLAVLAWTALTAQIQGKSEDAEQLLIRCRQIAERLRRVPPILDYAEVTRSMLVDSPATARAGLAVLDQAAMATANRGERQMMELFAAILAAFYGTREEAFAHVTPMLADAEETGAQLALGYALWTAAVAELRHGSPDHALELLQRGLGLWYDMGDAWGPTWGVWLAAVIAAAREEQVLAAVLFGHAQLLQERTSSTVTGLRSFLGLQQEAMAACQRALGPRRFDREFSQGKSLSYDQAIELALVPPTRRSTVPRPGGLSERELEIADLVSTGMTNGEIAARLNLSTRTVEDHIQKARRKVGAHTRGALGAWLHDQERR
ncbi:ATP-binding protein [Amycolatopsis nigrescens]|uniref:ATP-binding protein n=1 Tax=Amycolatopsis nigrescens TaxID=381445 RepID=UPI00146C27FE|nr:LuxR C-terminal-related transcriptional regulator [Amycolatopsis nigrescens]